MSPRGPWVQLCILVLSLIVSSGSCPQPSPVLFAWVSFVRVTGSPDCSVSLCSSPGTGRGLTRVFFLLQVGSKAERGDLWSLFGSRPPGLAGGAGARRQIAVWQQNPPALANSALLQLSPSSDGFCTRFPRDTTAFCVISAGDSSTEPSPSPPPSSRCLLCKRVRCDSAVVTPPLGPDPPGHQGHKLGACADTGTRFFLQRLLTLLAGSGSKQKSAQTRYCQMPRSGKK